ncbi:MAG TPA: peptidase T [Gemmataceae bacterium]|nr:peptidase T [Gemmataceae bacterium]
MNPVLERFCRYVRVDTQAVEGAKSYPSSPGQLELGRMLLGELRELGLKDAEQDAHGIIMATIPATFSRSTPVIAWLAHMDTSPETSGKNVKPQIIANYDGSDIALPGDRTKVIRVAENPELRELNGCTLVTTDGTTLLGADNKAGITVIMETAGYLLAHPEIPRGPIRICFTCDEEIGHGVDYVDLKKLGAVAAYTLDGAGQGEIEGETFSADKATVTITGVNIHPSIGKGRMVNAIRLTAMFLDRLPKQALSPETTEGREGFIHPVTIEGGVGETVIRMLLRDHHTPNLAKQAALLHEIAAQIMLEFPKAKVKVEVEKQYRNMADGMVKEPRAMKLAEEATRRAGLTPKFPILRGGTDGSRLTELGLPTPNLSTGEHNPHSPLEWTCLEDMQAAVRVLVELAQLWGKESR